MPKYIFLDTWLLIKYTRPDIVDSLAKYIKQNQYTIIISSLQLGELYNEEWQEQDEQERGARVVRFLSGQHCVVVDPASIWRHEYLTYPNRLSRMPIELDLAKVPNISQAEALLRFLRRDEVFLKMGKDIAAWAKGYGAAKEGWSTDKDSIIEDGVNGGELVRDGKGGFRARDDAMKQQFLFRLDMRGLEDISPAELGASGYSLNRYIDGVFGKGILLRGIRLTSLGFWYKYIEFDPTARPKETGSDLGDIYFMTFIKRCGVKTPCFSYGDETPRAVRRCSLSKKSPFPCLRFAVVC